MIASQLEAGLPASRKFALASALTALLVAPFEVVSYYQGTYPGYEIGVFGVPALIALTLFKALKKRLLAWFLLTLVSIFTIFATIVILWVT